jgi:M6 family metalloprotease-like protein
MQRKSRLALAIVVLLSLSSPVHAAAPKAGTACKKAGQTSTLAGIKYTCVKSGKKLVWNKGVAIKKAEPAPVPTPETKVEVKSLLSNDPRITALSTLTSLEICKTVDKTPEYDQNRVIMHKNGFPRPVKSVSGKKSAKILVIPMSFTDLPFRKEKYQRVQLFTSDLDTLNETIPLVKESYKKLSGGRFDITIDVLPEKDWWIINSDNPLSGAWGVDNFGKIGEIIEKNKKDFNFDEYDTYVFITGFGVQGQAGLGSAQAAFNYTHKSAKSGSFNAVLMAGGFNNTTLWVHELGHSLYAFEDLYLFNEAQTQTSGTLGIKDMNVPNKWDLMADSSRGTFLEWNRYMMGWIYDSEVRCLVDQNTSVHYLTDIDTTTDPKLLTINLAPGVTLAAEARNAAGVDKGLLLYIINTYVNHGEGPILTQNNLLAKGQTKAMLGWEFTVLDSDEKGLLVSVKKTDVDKFVVPPEKPAENNPGQPTSPIRVSRGDVVPKGSLQGRATWNVTGHESYRLYVTDVVDFQKVYFETGYVNDSRNPLVIDIKGLVCKKEFRTMTEFFTEKNGKGERLVIPSLQLRDLPCP